MADYKKVRANFTSYVEKVIINTSINYNKKITSIKKREIHFSEKVDLIENNKNENYIVDTLVENIDYFQLENLFTNEKYFYAMKKLSDREKLVLYLTVIEEKSLRTVARLLETSEDNIGMIKYRAKNKFLKFLK